MIVAVNVTRNAAAGVRSVPLLAAMRRPRPAGGGLGDYGTYDVAAALQQSYQTAIAGLAYEVERGTAANQDAFAMYLFEQARMLCSGVSWGQAADRCAIPTDVILQLVTQYGAALGSILATKLAQVASGDICAPSSFLTANPGVVLSERAIAACGYGAAPATPSGGGNSTAYATPSIAPAPTYPTTIQTQVPTGGGISTVAANTPAQAVARNLSRPNLPFRVGDMFSLDVMGAPNAMVKITATKNGTPVGTTSFGATDGHGQRSITGTMTAAEIGSWLEVIQVGDGGQPYTLSFNVSPAAVNSAGQQTTSTGAGSSQTGGGSTTATNVNDSGDTDTAPPAPAADTGGLTIGGVHLSTPVLLGVAAAALFYFSGGRR